MTPSISFDCLYYIHVQQHDSSFDDWQFKNGKYKINLHKVSTKFTLSKCLVSSLAPHFRLLVVLTNWNQSPKKRIDGLKFPTQRRQTLCHQRVAESIPVSSLTPTTNLPNFKVETTWCDKWLYYNVFGVHQDVMVFRH